MANRYFVGAVGTQAAPTAWNTTASWSTSQNGASGASVPIAGDAIYLNKNKAATAFLNVATTALPNGVGTSIIVSAGGGSNNQYTVQGANATTAGLAWTLTNPVTIQVDSGCVLTYRNAITGGGTITKTGAGLFGNDTLTTTLGTSPINLQAGVLFANNAATNKLGTGKITMSAGTAIYNTSPSAVATLGNPLDIRGDVFLNVNGSFGADNTAKGVLLFTAAVDLDSVTRTINVGALSTSAPVQMSGAITGTAGLTLEGGSYLWFQTASTGLSGTVAINTANSLIVGPSVEPPNATGNLIPNVTAFNLAVSGAGYQIRSNTAFTLPQTISGPGFLAAFVTAAGGLTIPAANVAAHTGYIGAYGIGTTAYINFETFNGIAFFLQGANPRSINTYTGSSSIVASLATTLQAIVNPTGSVIGTFRQNAPAGNTVTFPNTVSVGNSTTATATFELGGSNADNNTVSGNIVNGTATTFNVQKSDAGKWILSGTNTFNGSILATGTGTLVLSGSNTASGASSLTGGTLTVAHQNALQNTTLTWQTAGTTLNFDAALTAATFGGLAGTAAGLTLTIPAALTLSVGNNNSANTFANAVSGSGTLNRIGTGGYTYSGSFAGFTGTVILTNGPTTFSGSSFGVMTFSHPTAANQVTKYLAITPTVTNGYTFPAGFQLSGDGMIAVTPYNTTTLTTGFTFPVGALTNLTGTAAGSAGSAGAVAGLLSQTSSAATTSVFNIHEFPGGGSPGVLTYEYITTATGAMTQSIYYVSAAATHNYQTRIDIINYSGGTSTNSSTANLYANQATGPLVLSGGIVRYGQNTSQTVALTLRGTSTADNEISGAITQTSGVLAVTKTDAGKWILSGAGNHTGATTITGGELVIKNTNAVQNSTVTWQTPGTTLTLDPSVTDFTFGSLVGSFVNLTLSIGASQTLSVGNNNSTDLNIFANAVSGTGTLRKVGTGTQTYIGSFAGFTGTTELTNGNVTYSCSAFGAATFNHATVGVWATKTVSISPTVINGYSFPAGFQLSGAGKISISSGNVTSPTTGFTLPVGALTNLTGTAAGSAVGPVAGLTSFTSNTTATNIININEFPGGGSPGVLSYDYFATTTGAMTQSIYYVSAAATHNYPTRLDIINSSGGTSANTSQTANLYANQATGPLVLSGGVVRYGQNTSQTVTLTLRGTSTENNEITGSITQTSGVLAVTKADAGKWILSGSGNHTGATSITGGELVIDHATAVQNSTVTWQTAGTTLTIDPSLTTVTFGGLAGTGAGLTLPIPSTLTLSVGNNNTTNTFANAVSGTGTLTKIGTAQQIISGSMSGFTGTSTLSAGILSFSSADFGAGTYTHTTVGVRATKYLEFSPTITNGYSFPAGFQLTGNGVVFITPLNATTLTTGFTLPSGATSGLTGTAAGAATGTTAGLALYADSTKNTNIVNLVDLPGGGAAGVLTYEYVSTTTAAQTQSVFYNSAGATHNYATRIDVTNYAGLAGTGTALSSAAVANLYANQATGPLVLSGGVVRYANTVGQTVTLTLRGTNTENNEISGAITQTSGILALTKNDAGKWVLSGTNTYTGVNTLTAGTLLLTNGAALGGSAASTNTTLTAGTLQVQGGITVNKASSPWVLNGATVENVSGANTITAASWSLGAATAVNATAGTLTVTNAISGAGTLTKNGSGILALTNTSSTFSNAVTVNAGELSVSTLANTGSSSSLGTGSTSSTITMGSDTKLTVTGACATNRTINSTAASGSGLTLALASTATATVVYNGPISFSNSGPHTLTFVPTVSIGTATIKVTSTLEDAVGGGAVSLTLNGGDQFETLTLEPASGVINCTGQITINLGRVYFNRLDGNTLTIPGPIVLNDGSFNNTYGPIEANITVNKGFSLETALAGTSSAVVNSTVTSATPLSVKPNNSNSSSTNTGNWTVGGYVTVWPNNTSSLKPAGRGKFFGTNNTVTVTSTGTIRTGQFAYLNGGYSASCRYHNLTLQNGSRLKIGTSTA